MLIPHVKCLYDNQRNTTVLIIIRKYLDSTKLKFYLKHFFNSQFKYSSLTWMFHSRNANTKSNKLHQNSLKLACGDNYRSTSEELLGKDLSLFIILIYKHSA